MPIMAIVLLLSFTVAPMPGGVLLTFLFGGGLLIAGMMLFSLGAELAMAPMGERIGAGLTKSRKLWLILLLGFLLGFMITISEPDLQVLADQVPGVPNVVLIVCVAAGVGVFLLAAMLRMLFKVPLRVILIVFYAAVFILAMFAPKSFTAVAFDSGGVTTGPMTVPFIMSFGLGVSAIRSDKHAYADSFGLVSVCSIGPILAVLILSLIYKPDAAAYTPAFMPEIENSVQLGEAFLSKLPKYLGEMALSLLPIALFFYIFQFLSLRLEKRTVFKISVGIVYTFAGLVVFLTGVNVGFMPAGAFLGSEMAGLSINPIIIPIGMLIGYFIVQAEPSVYVLMKQVEELTDGDIGGSSLKLSLSLGVAASVGLSMVRVLTGVSVMWFILPGYVIALGLSFFTPKLFTAVAFDAGGVASGPMTTTFLLPFAVGASSVLGGNIVTDAFGLVSMVAMTPIITIQILGLVYRLKGKKNSENAELDAFADIGEYDIIEL
ncbi:MAG: DUF1538 domain-containing protein [Clostridia bacterium]|nr:DUF1538 domain-containing protein [Clostridia bacterium]